MESELRQKLRGVAWSARVWVERGLGASAQSLPARLIVGVFSTVLLTSLAVAWTATHSTEAFLRGKIDQKFPAMLERTGERLELWYAQRQLDVVTFARSSTVVGNAPVLARGQRGRRLTRARGELHQYLQHVLERSTEYRALFLVQPSGELLTWVGEELALPNSLKEGLAGLREARVSDLEVAGGLRTQVASAPIGGEARAGFLHAVLRPRGLDGLLRADGLSESGRIVVVGRDGTILAPGGEGLIPPPDGAAASGEVGALPVEEHVLPGGERIIAARRGFERFGWSLWVMEPYDAAFAPVVALIRRVWAINLGIVLVLGAVAFWIARSVAHPIHELAEAAFRIAEGADDVAIPVSERADEVGVLTRALREMTSRLGAKNAELQRANEVLTQLSITDGLTSLHNHRAFQDRLARDARRALRTKAPLCLALLDVDDFKGLNDRHGHAVGDRVLARVAALLQENVHDEDFVARYGGEEFAVLSAAPLAETVTLAENLRRIVADEQIALREDESPVSVTVSVGVAPFEADAAVMFREADRALYDAKHSGKDCVVAASSA